MKHYEKAIEESNSTISVCVQFQFYFTSFCATAHLKSGLQISGPFAQSSLALVYVFHHAGSYTIELKKK